MKAKLGRRVGAYIIDTTLLLLITTVCFMFFQDDLDSSIKANNENYVNGIITFNEFLTNSSILYQSQDKMKIEIYIINIIYIIGYFIIIPLYNNGSTLGKKIMGIKVEAAYNQKLTFKSLFIRNLVINGLLYFIIVILTLYILPAKAYFILNTITGFIQITLVIISVFMVLYRKDKRGIHDLLAQTKVVTIN